MRQERHANATEDDCLLSIDLVRLNKYWLWIFAEYEGLAVQSLSQNVLQLLSGSSSLGLAIETFFSAILFSHKFSPFKFVSFGAANPTKISRTHLPRKPRRPSLLQRVLVMYICRLNPSVWFHLPRTLGTQISTEKHRITWRDRDKIFCGSPNASTKKCFPVVQYVMFPRFKPCSHSLLLSDQPKESLQVLS